MYNPPVLERPAARPGPSGTSRHADTAVEDLEEKNSPPHGGLNVFQTDRTGTLDASSWSLLPTIHQNGAAADLQSSPTEDAAK